MASIKIYDTLKRQKRVFKPWHPPEVKLYTCGPTVYQSLTIGNWRTFIFEDVLKRVLLQKGFQVNHLMNVTDVGHLTSDADSGEDKLAKAAKLKRKTAWQIAQEYTAEFKREAKSLNILPPTKLVKATDYIAEQIEFAQALEKKGLTYLTSDGLYFNTAKVKNYGQLAQLDIKGLKEGQRVEKNPEKKNPSDFALWKFSKKGEKRDMEWPSPWGVGFPGWHLECSTMILKELGPKIDIHCGAVDLIPTHHTNEIAQSESLTGQSLAKYWCHGEFLLVNGRRMGKSQGNAYTLTDLLKRGYSPLDLRFFYYQAHYRQKLNFTWAGLDAAKKSLNQIRFKIQSTLDSNQTKAPSKSRKFVTEFGQAVSDDLNMPKAVAILNRLVDTKIPPGELVETLKHFDQVFALNLIPQKTTIPRKVLQLKKQRDEARKQKDWARADYLRHLIEKEGYGVVDQKDTSVLISH